MKIVSLFFIFTFLITLVSAFSLEASPDEVFLKATVGEKVCKDIVIQVSEESKIIISDRWAERGFTEKILVAHKLNPEEISITSDYSESLNIKDEKTITFCVSSEDEGKYHGVLLVKGEGYPVGIGIWINLEVSQRDSLFTGLVINNNEPENSNLIYIFLSFLVIILLEIFFLIRKKRNH